MLDWPEQASQALSALPAHETVRDLLWVVPVAQSVHILAVAIVFAGSVVIALRALNLTGTFWTLDRWQRYFAWGTGLALLVLLLSGGVLVLAEPERELLNSLFQIKMPLVVATTLLSYGVGRQFKYIPAGHRASFGVRLGAVTIFLLWAVIMALGRWIAYAG